jgi:hypothetical protein
MCIVTITLPVQSQENERSCVLLPLHYLYKARKMSRHVYNYHYTTSAKVMVTMHMAAHFLGFVEEVFL